jgi:hypothetical protein
LPPPPELAPYVECFWVGRGDAAPPFRPREALVPDGTTELMLNFGGPYVRYTAPDAPRGSIGRCIPCNAPHEAGYADQAHFSREFLDLVGLTSSAFLAQRYTIATITEPARGKRLGDA